MILVLTLAACNNNGNKETVKTTGTDTSLTASATGVPQQIMALSHAVLEALKAKDYQKFAGYFHPDSGVRFSPYAFVEPANDIQLTSEDLLMQLSQNEPLTWGTYDGSGEPITSTVAAYIEKFVYDANFLNAEKTAVDSFIGSGNSLNNLREAYPTNVHFTEHYFSGFDKKYEGMDWRTLRLVWALHEGKYYLVGIVHDQWTI